RRGREPRRPVGGFGPTLQEAAASGRRPVRAEGLGGPQSGQQDRDPGPGGGGAGALGADRVGPGRPGGRGGGAAVGGVHAIAAARLGALRKRTVQDLETWDDNDELVARSIGEALLGPTLVRRREPDGDRVVEKALTVAEALEELELPAGRVQEVVRAVEEGR